MKKIILILVMFLGLTMRSQNTPVLSTLSPTSFSTVNVATRNIINPNKVVSGLFNNDSIADFAVGTDNDTLTFVAGKTTNLYTNVNKYALPGLKDFNVYPNIDGSATPVVISVNPAAKNTSFNVYLLGSGTGTLPATPGAINLTTTPAYSYTFPFRGYQAFDFGQIDNTSNYDIALVGQEGLATVRYAGSTYTTVTKYNNISGLSTVKVYNATSAAGHEVITGAGAGNTIAYFGAQAFVSELSTFDYSGVTSIHAFPVNDTATNTLKVGILTSAKTIKTYTVSGATITNDSVYVSPSVPYKVVVGDMNGDHKNDVVSADLDGNIRIYRGTSNTAPKFTLAGTYNIGEQVKSIAVGDFNNDGKLDIVYVGFRSNKVIVLTQS